MNWQNIFSGQKDYAVKKTLLELLQTRYKKSELIIERVCTALQTEEDAKTFIALVVDAYELGYLRSVEDHKAQLEKIGLVARVTAPQSK